MRQFWASTVPASSTLMLISPRNPSGITAWTARAIACIAVCEPLQASFTAWRAAACSCAFIDDVRPGRDLSLLDLLGVHPPRPFLTAIRMARHSAVRITGRPMTRQVSGSSSWRSPFTSILSVTFIRATCSLPGCRTRDDPPSGLRARGRWSMSWSVGQRHDGLVEQIDEFLFVAHALAAFSSSAAMLYTAVASAFSNVFPMPAN